jgi:hypothetical protein
MAAVAVGITMGDGACRWMSPAISGQNIAVTITDHNLGVTITGRPSGSGPQEFGLGPTAAPLIELKGDKIALSIDVARDSHRK